jgi:hypothetical protein
MTANERYATSGAFRAALQDRLRLAAHGKSEIWLVQRRKFMAFDRLLARLFLTAPERWILKGAVALDFRLGERARGTIDLDLYRSGQEAAATADLQKIQFMDLGDFFSFEVARTSTLDDLIGGIAVRYKVTANLDGRRFEQVTVDVGFDQYISSRPDLIRGPDYFSFAGIPPIQVPTLPLEQHIAEKLHAYTRIYSDGRQSSTAKDLIDLVLIAQNSPFEAERLRHAVTSTFSSRQSQLLPDSFPGRPPNG